MKTNPSCTRPDCPREFPEKQNFCNICGAKLILTDSLQHTQSEEIYKTVVNRTAPEEQPKTTFSGQEAELQSELDDVLQIPQESFDPMKTMLASSDERSTFLVQEEKIFDMPESEELKTTFAGIEKPFEKAIFSESQPFKKEEKLHSTMESSPKEFSFKEPDVLEQYLPTLEKPIFTAQQEEKPIEPLLKPKSEPEELPKTVIEPETKISSPKTPYEPPSPFASPQTSYSETQASFTKREFTSEPTPLQPPTIFQSPFEESSAYKAQGQQMSWTPPPLPQSSWEDRPIGPGSAFTPPVSDKSDNTLAIVSLVCGILSIVCCGFIAGIPAIITGFIAKNRAESQPNLYGGRGMAIAGIVMGMISIIFSILALVYYLVLAIISN